MELTAASGWPILNHMVQYSAALDDAFTALSDATRRGVLDRLGRGEASITELADLFGMTLTGMKKHVAILEDARLVRTEKIGRTRVCTVGPARLDEVAAWIAQYRRTIEERLDHLDAYLQRTRGQP
jgi:DNA-binding transcriptional ArsR family regulator